MPLPAPQITAAGQKKGSIPDSTEFARAPLIEASSGLRWALFGLPLAYLWLRLIDNLRLEWTTNPQYSFGLVVPLLCVGLMARKWPLLPNNVAGENRTKAAVLLLTGFLAFLYLPTRLIEVATPEWRPIQWMLGVEAAGLTLCAIQIGKGRSWLGQLWFPIVFFFVAIPWPTMVEAPIIQGLTRLSAAIVIELLGLAGVPAMPHGNVIEVATGVVGIDEACSGIRSFQSSFMISLFLGEFYELAPHRRLLLVPAGLLLSFGLNVARMFLLTDIAAARGTEAIGKYHDPAGVTIAIGCTLVIWGLAAWWKKGKPAGTRRKQLFPSVGEGQPTLAAPAVTSSRNRVFRNAAMALIAWLVMVESGVQLWYRHQESNLKPAPDWSVKFPAENANFTNLPISEKTRYLLRFDEGRQAAWTEPDGSSWQVFYCSWRPGKVAGYLAKRHTPEICLQGIGYELVSGPELTLMRIKGLDLPVRSYVFKTESGLIQVFHCRWEAGVNRSAYVEHESARFNLIRGIWAGRGNKGQKILEVIINGQTDAGLAKEAVARQLERIITVKKA